MNAPRSFFLCAPRLYDLSMRISGTLFPTTAPRISSDVFPSTYTTVLGRIKYSQHHRSAKQRSSGKNTGVCVPVCSLCSIVCTANCSYQIVYKNVTPYQQLPENRNFHTPRKNCNTSCTHLRSCILRKGTQSCATETLLHNTSKGDSR